LSALFKFCFSSFFLNVYSQSALHFCGSLLANLTIFFVAGSTEEGTNYQKGSHRWIFLFGFFVSVFVLLSPS
jgi:hypothetical protein